MILNLCFYDKQEKHIQQLKKGIRDKENPLKVAQSRLEARTHRPDMELCRDPPHHRIVEEVGQIQESVVSSQNFREIAKKNRKWPKIVKKLAKMAVNANNTRLCENIKIPDNF